jgi:hypothetical protein
LYFGFVSDFEIRISNLDEVNPSSAADLYRALRSGEEMTVVVLDTTLPGGLVPPEAELSC